MPSSALTEIQVQTALVDIIDASENVREKRVYNHRVGSPVHDSVFRKQLRDLAQAASNYGKFNLAKSLLEAAGGLHAPHRIEAIEALVKQGDVARANMKTLIANGGRAGAGVAPPPARVFEPA
jgi:hypothetical protein